MQPHITHPQPVMFAAGAQQHLRMTADGRKLETARITNSPAELRKVIAWAGKRPQVVLEATYGWAVDRLAAAGAQVHLAHRWA